MGFTSEATEAGGPLAARQPAPPSINAATVIAATGTTIPRFTLSPTRLAHEPGHVILRNPKEQSKKGSGTETLRSIREAEVGGPPASNAALLQPAGEFTTCTDLGVSTRRNVRLANVVVPPTDHRAATLQSARELPPGTDFGISTRWDVCFAGTVVPPTDHRAALLQPAGE